MGWYQVIKTIKAHRYSHAAHLAQTRGDKEKGRQVKPTGQLRLRGKTRRKIPPRSGVTSDRVYLSMLSTRQLGCLHVLYRCDI